MDLGFIKEINEARMTRNKNNQRVLTYTDCCERTYLTLLILETMRQFSSTNEFAKKYARQTTMPSDYTSFRVNGTDLYNFIYFVMGDEEALNKLKDPGAAKKVRAQTTLPLVTVNNYLIQLKNGRTPNEPSAMFLKLERELKIVNQEYKSVRRFVTNMTRARTEEAEIYITRLLIAARAKLRTSDIIDDFEKLVASKNLETSKVNDTEPKVSVPDITTSGSDLIYYQYIVGRKNLMQAKKFLELAKNGQGVPQQFVQAYLPAVVMIDDIVKGGPAFVQQLRLLHNRAKKSLED